VVVGSFNQDHVWRSERFPQPGQTQLGQFSSGPGGKGFNQAVACVRQAVTTAFVGALGRDRLGDAAEALARAEGMQSCWQRVAGEATGTAVILLDASGQNMIVVAPGANGALDAAHVSAQSALIAGARVLVTQHEVALPACIEAMRIARRHGVLTLHNPAPVGDLETCAALLPLADVLTPNETEFEALLAQRGQGLPPDWATRLDAAQLHERCRMLQVPTVVLTLGSAGVFVSHADPARLRDLQPYYRQPAEAVRVVDTTGAGDAFNGGLAAALAVWPDGAFADAVRRAGRVAGLAVERAGAALAMPRRTEVEQRFGS
jgi:ribokinase